MEKLNREQLIELVDRIKNAEGETEEENDALIDLFLENVPDPNASNYIFEIEYEDLSTEEVVDKALSYKPFQL